MAMLQRMDGQQLGFPWSLSWYRNQYALPAAASAAGYLWSQYAQPVIEAARNYRTLSRTYSTVSGLATRAYTKQLAPTPFRGLRPLSSGTDKGRAVRPTTRKTQSRKRSTPSTRMAYRRTGMRSYGRFRRRSRFAPRFTRRVRRRSIFRRAGSSGAVVKKRFLCESIQGVSLTAIGPTQTNTTALSYYTSLPAWAATTAFGPVAGGTMTYMFQFSLAHLTQGPGTGNSGYALTVANSYDAARIAGVSVRLRSGVSPKSQVTVAGLTANTTAYNFQFLPTYDSSVTWIDEDCSFNLTQLNVSTVPGNGDITELVQGRLDARMHKAFSNVSRSFKPFVSYLLAAPGASGSAGPNPVVANGAAPQRPPWLAQLNSPTPHCGLGFAIAYQGFLNTSAQQPQYSYLPEVTYDVHLRSPLF